MALWIVPTPIGNAQDFTLRALQTLRDVPIIVVEEFKESTQWLRAHQISGKQLESLNEHSTDDDVRRLMELCQQNEVALISDSGTPGFCDPGPRLIKACRAKGIAVRALPGPSSLMTLLSLSSRRIEQFYFRGFLPAETSAREAALVHLKAQSSAHVPVVLMDTPYRLGKTAEDLLRHFRNSHVLWGLNLSQENELILEGTVHAIHQDIPKGKWEFILVLWP